MKAIPLALVPMVAILASCAPPALDEVSEGAVHIEAKPCGRSANGSGLTLEDGLVLTNAHLVAGSTDDVQVETGDGEVLSAVVVGFDVARDLALLAVDGLEAESLELADAESGAEVSIMARPVDSEIRVLEARVSREFNATGDDIYGEGDVSRRALELNVDVVTGVSGAGVYDADGRLVGVVFAESRRRDKVAYAVTSSEVRVFVEETDATSAANTRRCREP